MQHLIQPYQSLFDNFEYLHIGKPRNHTHDHPAGTVYQSPRGIDDLPSQCRCPHFLPFSGENKLLEDKGKVIGQDAVPKIGVVAHELPSRHLCNKVVIIQVLDVEFYLCPPVIVSLSQIHPPDYGR